MRDNGCSYCGEILHSGHDKCPQCGCWYFNDHRVYIKEEEEEEE
jgi:RNA polymerase subunit RPABC4/transcription elongation factor Spt4